MQFTEPVLPAINSSERDDQTPRLEGNDSARHIEIDEFLRGVKDKNATNSQSSK